MKVGDKNEGIGMIQRYGFILPVNPGDDIFVPQECGDYVAYDDYVAKLAEIEAENAALKVQVETFKYGENYIKQFTTAQQKCAEMYPPEEVYTQGQLEYWAEENGYTLLSNRNEGAA